MNIAASNVTNKNVMGSDCDSGRKYHVLAAGLVAGEVATV